MMPSGVISGSVNKSYKNIVFQGKYKVRIMAVKRINDITTRIDHIVLPYERHALHIVKNFKNARYSRNVFATQLLFSISGREYFHVISVQPVTTHSSANCQTDKAHL